MTTLKRILAVIRSYDDQMPVPVFEMISVVGLGPDYQVMDNEYSGKIVRADNEAGYLIVINSRHHPNRRRFTGAHELGHYIYHRDLLDGGTGDTLAYRSDGSESPNERIGPAQETEANRFAANLLMPNRLIEKLQAEGIEDPALMAERLGVSEAAMRIKLGLAPKPDLFG